MGRQRTGTEKGHDRNMSDPLDDALDLNESDILLQDWLAFTRWSSGPITDEQRAEAAERAEAAFVAWRRSTEAPDAP